MSTEEHDPWNEVEDRHPRARELMADELWDCVDEDAPFGSDEGAQAYEEYLRWRDDNPGAPLSECLSWIGDEASYADAFTYDATILATVLGQLVREGRIDADAKGSAYKAIARQAADATERRLAFLRAAEAAIIAG